MPKPLFPAKNISLTPRWTNCSVPYGDLSTYTGYQMDVEGELEALKTQIAEHQVITREPVYLTTGGGSGNHGVGGTYVELNLTRQHLWYQNGANLPLIPTLSPEQ